MIKYLFLLIIILFFQNFNCFALNIEKITTNNDINILGIKNSNLSTIDIIINFRNCGYFYDYSNAQGCGFILQEIINHGLFKNDPKQYLKTIYGRNFHINAKIDEKNFTIYVKAMKDDITEVLKLLKKAIAFQIKINCDDLAYLQKIVAMNKQMDKEDINYNIFNELKNNIFANYPINKKKYPEGDNINLFNNEKILYKHQNVFARNNLTVSIVGDYDDSVKNKIDDTLSNLYLQKNNKKISPIYVHINTDMHNITHNNIKKTLVFSALGEQPQDVNYAKQIILLNIFDHNTTKSFNALLQQDHDFYHSINCKLLSMHDHNIIIGHIKTSNPKETRNKFTKIINNIDYYLTDEIIEINKKNIIEKIENMEKISNKQKVEILNWMQNFNLSENYFDKLLEQIKKTKPHEIRSYIKNTLNVKKMHFIEFE